MSILLKRSRNNNVGPRAKKRRVHFALEVNSSPPHIYPIIEKIKKCVDDGPWSKSKLMYIINAIKDQKETDVKLYREIHYLYRDHRTKTERRQHLYY